MNKSSTLLMLLGLLFSSANYAALSTQEIKEAYQQSYQYEKTQNHSDAIKALSLVALHYPNTYTVNLRLGYLYLQNAQYANASKHYDLAHSILKDAISPSLGGMSVAILTQNYDKAEQIGFLILKADLYNYFANLKLSYVFVKQSKFDLAEKTILKMLNKYPEDVAFLAQLAQLYVAKKEYNKAQETYTSVLILDPENITAKYYFSTLPAAVK